ncbi:hypothetical protein ACLKA7_000112 [Drosophila subpalustris]
MQVTDWLGNNSLSLAAHKTETVLIRSRKVVEVATIEVAGCTIASKPAIKYLGVQLDHRLTFKDHLNYAAKDDSISWHNVKCWRTPTTKLIANLVRSIILYAAPVWAPAMTVKAYGKSCKAAYRTCALRVLSAFLTVFDDL